MVDGTSFQNGKTPDRIHNRQFVWIELGSSGGPRLHLRGVRQQYWKV
jgi:hypothetical protein